MTWKTSATITGVLLAAGTILGTTWAGLDYIGLRPVVNGELKTHLTDFDQVASAVSWIILENLERKLARGGLTREECAKYRALAASLGIVPKPC